MYHNFFPCDPFDPYSHFKEFIKELALITGTTVISTMLFDSDVLAFTMSNGDKVHVFSRGANLLKDFSNDESEKLDEDFPNNIWLSLLAPGYSLFDLKTEINRYDESRNIITDWASISDSQELIDEALSSHLDAFDLQMNLAKLMGCNLRLSNYDYDHATDLDFSEDYLKGFTVLQILFKNPKQKKFY